MKTSKNVEKVFIVVQRFSYDSYDNIRFCYLRKKGTKMVKLRIVLYLRKGLASIGERRELRWLN